MIYCSSLNIIFFKTKKVGGTSFEITLSKYCNSTDIVTPITTEDENIRVKLGYQSPINYRAEQRTKDLINQDITGDFKNHMTSKNIYENMGKKLFNKCTKIAIHRDPLDFLISQYFFRMKKSQTEKQSFSEWLSLNYKNVIENYKIAPLDGIYAPDIILRYDTLNDDIKNTKELPKDFICVFNTLNAKGNFRPPDSRKTKSFFQKNGCENYIPKIIELTKEYE